LFLTNGSKIKPGELLLNYKPATRRYLPVNGGREEANIHKKRLQPV